MSDTQCEGEDTCGGSCMELPGCQRLRAGGYSDDDAGREAMYFDDIKRRERQRQDDATTEITQQIDVLGPLLSLASEWDVEGLTAQIEALDADDARAALMAALLILASTAEATRPVTVRDEEIQANRPGLLGASEVSE